MENREAIELLKGVAAYADTEYKKAITLAIAALDKQIPRRKLEKCQYNENLFTLRCPTCGNLIGSYNKRISRFSYRVLKNENYCCICGQAIDFSEPQQEDLDG